MSVPNGGTLRSFNKAVTRAKLRVEMARSKWPVVDVAVRTLTRYSEDDGGFYAAALTYFTFFSIFPLLLTAASLLGYLTFGNEDLRRDILRAGVDAFPLLRDVLKPAGLAFVEERRRAFAATGVALALYSGSGAVVALEHALNKIHRGDAKGDFLARRVRSLKWLAVLGLASLASIALGGVTNFAGELFGEAAGPVASALGLVGGLFANVVIFGTAFKFLPSVHPAWREVLPGALFTAVVFELLKVVGSLYLETGSETREATFGAFAVAAGLLVASYLVAQVILLAAEVNAVLVERRSTRESSMTTTGEAQ
ncbi:MAG: YihY/virulence factor BrkB family protein [Actinobacteria bacterium]|nr:YihY/virulence factor BrkB family protein [Actinomycetota bacterium]